MKKNDLNINAVTLLTKPNKKYLFNLNIFFII
jgi:hypothetical protein